jgi:hypothetical protein
MQVLKAKYGDEFDGCDVELPEIVEGIGAAG